MRRKNACRIQDIFANEIAVRRGLLNLQFYGSAGSGQNCEHTSQHAVRPEVPRINMSSGNPHQVPRPVDIDRHMRTATAIADPPVGVITENGQIIRRLIDIRESQLILFFEFRQVLFELVIHHQGREHRHENRRAIPAIIPNSVGFDHLRILVIETGKDGARSRLVDGQMVVIRAGIRLIFRHAFGTTEPNGAGFYAILTLEIGQDRLSHGAAERGLRPISILGGYLDLPLDLIKRLG